MPTQTRTERSAGGVVFRLGLGDRIEIALILTHEGRWQLPKGWIEAGELPDRTALREVREEAGVDAEVVGELDTIEYWYRATYEPQPVRVHKFVTFYLLRYLAGSPEDHDDEVQEARWVSLTEAPRLLAFKEERRIVGLAAELMASI